MSPIGWIRMVKAGSKKEVVDVRNLEETLAQIRTWSVMGGAVAEILKALEPARAFPRVYFFGLWMGEALAGDAARRPLDHITSELMAYTKPGDLIITHGPPAQDVAFLCAQHRRRVLLVIPIDRQNAVKKALKTLPWMSMPALVEKPKAPRRLTAEEEDAVDAEIARKRIAEIKADPSKLIGGEELEKRLRQLEDEPDQPEASGSIDRLVCMEKLKTQEEIRPSPKKVRMLVDEPDRPEVGGAFVTRIEGKLGALRPEEGVQAQLSAEALAQMMKDEPRLAVEVERRVEDLPRITPFFNERPSPLQPLTPEMLKSAAEDLEREGPRRERESWEAARYVADQVTKAQREEFKKHIADEVNAEMERLVNEDARRDRLINSAAERAPALFKKEPTES